MISYWNQFNKAERGEVVVCFRNERTEWVAAIILLKLMLNRDSPKMYNGKLTKAEKCLSDMCIVSKQTLSST